MNISNYSFEMNMDMLAKGVLHLTEDFHIVMADDEARNMLGAIVDSCVWELCQEEYREEFHEVLDKLKSNGSGRTLLVLKNQKEYPILADLFARYEPTENYSYVVEFWNLNSLEHRYATIYDNMWKYRTMLGQTNAIFYDYNVDNDFLSIYRYVGRKSNRLFYDTLEVFYRLMKSEPQEDERNKQAMDLLYEQLRTGKMTIDLLVQTGLLHKDQKRQTLHVQGRFDDMNGHRMIYGIVNVISEMEDDIPYYMTSAAVDSATGLLNKRALIEYSEDILTNKATAERKHYMVLLDIDDFKDINDNYGHQVGDKVISILASALQDVIEDRGIVGRYGGDEFYILTEQIEDEDTMRLVLRSIRQTAEKRVKENLQIEKFSLSMGVALYPEIANNYSDMLALTDKALYIAKEKGKNRYIIYRKEMHENVQTGAERKNSASHDEQSRITGQAVRNLFMYGTLAIEKTMEDMLKTFDLDNIDLYYGPGLERLYTKGKYPSQFKAEDFIGNRNLRDKFSADGVLIVNNYLNYKHSIPEIYTLLQERNCMALVQLVYPSVERPEFLLSFNMLNRIHKWSDSEVNNLSLYGSLMYEALKKEKQK